MARFARFMSGKLKILEKIRMLRARKGQRKSRQVLQEYLKENKTTKAEQKTLLAQGLKTFWGTVSFTAVLYFTWDFQCIIKQLLNSVFRDQPKPNNTYLILDNSGYHAKTSSNNFLIAHFQKEWKTGARVGVRSVMGSFGGARGPRKLKRNTHAPPNDPIINARPRSPPGFHSFWKWQECIFIYTTTERFLAGSLLERYGRWEYRPWNDVTWNAKWGKFEKLEKFSTRHTRARLSTDLQSNSSRNIYYYGIKQIDHIFPWCTLL